MIVSGSYLADNASSLDSAVYSLKYSDEKGVPVTRNMIKRDYLPLVNGNDGFFSVIDTINKWRLGICFVTRGPELLAVISDGDIRRAFLKHQRGVFDVSAAAIANPDFYYARESQTLEEVYSELAKLYKPISVVPILSGDAFIGALPLG